MVFSEVVSTGKETELKWNSLSETRQARRVYNRERPALRLCWWNQLCCDLFWRFILGRFILGRFILAPSAPPPPRLSITLQSLFTAGSPFGLLFSALLRLLSPLVSVASLPTTLFGLRTLLALFTAATASVAAAFRCLGARLLGCFSLLASLLSRRLGLLLQALGLSGCIFGLARSGPRAIGRILSLGKDLCEQGVGVGFVTALRELPRVGRTQSRSHPIF